MTRASVMVLATLAALSTGACHKKRGKPKSGVASACEAAVKHAGEVHGSVMPTDPKLAEYATKLNAAATGVLLQRCQADRWPKAALDCLNTATGDDDLDGCMDLLTQQQSMAVQMGINQAAEKLGPSPAAVAPPKVGQETAAEAIVHITQLKEKICQCPDATCAESVDKEWIDEESRSETAREQEGVSDQWQNIDDEYVKCHAKFPAVPSHQ